MTFLLSRSYRIWLQFILPTRPPEWNWYGTHTAVQGKKGREVRKGREGNVSPLQLTLWKLVVLWFEKLTVVNFWMVIISLPNWACRWSWRFCLAQLVFIFICLIENRKTAMWNFVRKFQSSFSCGNYQLLFLKNDKYEEAFAVSYFIKCTSAFPWRRFLLRYTGPYISEHSGFYSRESWL